MPIHALQAPELNALLVVLALTASAASLGLPFSRAFPRSLLPAERLALQTLAGFGLLGVAFFLCGMWNLSRWTVAGIQGLALIPALLAAPGYFRSRHSVESAHPRYFLPVRQWPRALIREWPYVLIGLVLLVRLVAAFDLPSGTSDDISYHLLGPKIWLREGSVHPVLAHSHTAFPATVEMLFAAGMALSNERAPGMLTIVIGALLLIQVWGLARRFGADSRTAQIAVLLAGTTPVILTRIGLAFVDAAFAAFALAAARILVELPSGWTLAAGGMFAGFAIGTKYPGVFLPLTFALLYLIPFGAQASFRVRLGQALQIGLVALLTGCPWYIRNYVELGSPLYPPPPFLAERLTVKAMPVESVKKLWFFTGARREKAVTPEGFGKLRAWTVLVGKSAKDLVLLPFRVTFETPLFIGFAGGIGLAMLAFAPIGILTLRRNDFAMRALIWILSLGLLWFFTQQELRLVIHLLAGITVFAAFGAVRCLSQPSRAGRILAITALTVTVGHGAILVFGEPSVRLRAELAGRGRLRYESTRMPGASAFEYVNTRAEVRRVLVNGRHFKLYYLDKPFVMVRGEHGEQPVEGIPDVATALLRLRDLNVTHVIDLRSKPGTDYEIQPSPDLELVFEDDPVRVYRVR